jgi:hypothetical protein
LNDIEKNMRRFLFFFCFFSYGYCTFIGNPALPALEHLGLIRECPDWWSIRLAYFGEYVYDQKFHEEFVIDDVVQTSSDVKLWTQAGILTFNLLSRIDLYGIVGGTRLKIDNDVLTKQHFAWGFGTKIIILQENCFRLGCDIKYFQSEQKPNFIQSENLAYNVTEDFYFKYHEIQAAIGVSYQRKYISPYANVSYLIAKLNPQPTDKVYVRLPMMNVEVDVPIKSATTSNHWGLAIGANIIDLEKATIAIEWRALNQNSINASFEIRF